MRCAVRMRARSLARARMLELPHAGRKQTGRSWRWKSVLWVCRWSGKRRSSTRWSRPAAVARSSRSSPRSSPTSRPSPCPTRASRSSPGSSRPGASSP
jgi:hypothetical protein